MNIAEALEFGTSKVATHSIIKSDKINVLALGLLKDQLLTKHEAKIPIVDCPQG